MLRAIIAQPPTRVEPAKRHRTNPRANGVAKARRAACRMSRRISLYTLRLRFTLRFPFRFPPPTRHHAAMSDTLTPIRPRKPRTQRARAALDGGFYAGLLHLAGLRESVTGTRRGIERHEPSARVSGTLIELALERIAAQTPSPAATSLDEAQRFALALRIGIAWLSRLVLLKVLETRCVALHDDNPACAFLNARTLGSFRDLGALCEAVFGHGDGNRDGNRDARFAHLPRLGAALIDTGLDARLIDMSTLDDAASLPRCAHDTAGETPLLAGLLDFFAAFDFSTGVAHVASSARPCIDAAALGLVFEKLNGYRDGAWYTPASVAMELARAAVTRAVLSAFNRALGKQYDSVDQLNARLNAQRSEAIFDRDAARAIFDAIRVCDPAVGSGHLLVSALNELLALKARFGLLEGLGDSALTIVADRLRVTRANGEPLCARRDREALRTLDAMLYREKRRLIEQSLFGVDIDADSVGMARVRLAIELLEHADFTERLPELAANLKQGNAALSDVDVANAADTAAPAHDDRGIAFSWRRAFPALFTQNGHAAGANGFDAVIANPPYIDSERMINAGQKPLRDALARRWPSAKGNWDLYVVFMELGLALLKPGGAMAYLTPDKWLAKPFGEAFRARHLRKIERIVALGRGVFDEARVDAIVTIFRAEDLDTLSTARLDGTTLAELTRVNKTALAAPWTLDALLSPHYAFARRLALAHPALGTLLGCENACATADAYRLAPLIEEAEENVDFARHYRVVNTGTLAHYVSRWGAKPMTYLGRQYRAPVVDRARFAATFANGYRAKADAKKVIVKGLTRLDAALDLAGDTIPGKTTLILRSHDEAVLKFAAALLNCPLSGFLIRAQYGASSYNGGVAFTKAMIDALPAPGDPALRARIVALVDRLLAFARAHEPACAQAIAREIDMAIYVAFGLTAAEIDVVEKRG
ncbi:type IIG restriction enzyme/methyltransferase [Paraburkholderia acidisoli]|uniref:site-specific DNA-methyltransferase (adenine-specific) n=1 Tax=Paraburkholderia acidisoli TaxID=2571748 RepID=A0A7Z2GIQ7_9BURK|nr:Eco57I restriction-modification methylase domain-containing protein [Paraburkholderia acidisoli]QGZ62471.1 N-6 DNA methylase [Paraburkholderia acidisoli]